MHALHTHPLPIHNSQLHPNHHQHMYNISTPIYHNYTPTRYLFHHTQSSPPAQNTLIIPSPQPESRHEAPLGASLPSAHPTLMHSPTNVHFLPVINLPKEAGVWKEANSFFKEHLVPRVLVESIADVMNDVLCMERGRLIL